MRNTPWGTGNGRGTRGSRAFSGRGQRSRSTRVIRAAVKLSEAGGAWDVRCDWENDLFPGPRLGDPYWSSALMPAARQDPLPGGTGPIIFCFRGGGQMQLRASAFLSISSFSFHSFPPACANQQLMTVCCAPRRLGSRGALGQRDRRRTAPCSRDPDGFIRSLLGDAVTVGNPRRSLQSRSRSTKPDRDIDLICSHTSCCAWDSKDSHDCPKSLPILDIHYPPVPRPSVYTSPSTLPGSGVREPLTLRRVGKQASSMLRCVRRSNIVTDAVMSRPRWRHAPPPGLEAIVG